AGAGRLSRSNLGNLGRNSRPRSISSLYELVGGAVDIPSSNPRQPATRYPSPLNDPSSQRQGLPLLLDKVTTVNGSDIPARINVNTAPRAVLATLPGLSDSDIQNILDHRPAFNTTDPPDPIYQTPAWLMTEANMSSQTLRSLERYITTRSQ